MFRKLLKQEWQNSSRLLGFLTLSVLGLGALGCLAAWFIEDYLSSPAFSGYSPAYPFLILMLIFGLIAGVFALAAYVVSVQIILLVRFYKSKFTDQGYLTFTLPVKAKSLFWSAFANHAFWTVISVLTFTVVFLSVRLILVGPAELWRDWLLLYSEFLAPLFETPEAGVQIVILAVLSLTDNAILPYVCITAGCTLAKKHKVLSSIGIYCAISSLIGLTCSVLPFILMLTDRIVSDLTLGILLIVSSLFQGGVAIGGYFLTVHLMKKKLNLN